MSDGGTAGVTATVEPGVTEVEVVWGIDVEVVVSGMDVDVVVGVVEIVVGEIVFRMAGVDVVDTSRAEF